MTEGGGTVSDNSYTDIGTMNRIKPLIDDDLSLAPGEKSQSRKIQINDSIRNI